jgi:hypothetical protein
MAQTVRCDICGKLFSLSHVKSHKRLAHPTSDLSGEEAAKKILALFKNLSKEEKGKVLRDLTDMTKEAG